ncbi:MAG: SHD1 domain-containing protein [Pirellulaceae bacterium]|nr:SHD1 domain-containing protein [Pirellulaceae bacterium]MDP7019591.1 SHD1 domain-containing protein [Pirellulaceae bacterium]
MTVLFRRMKKWTWVTALLVTCFCSIHTCALGQAERKLRTWRDSTGKFSIDAEFVRVAGEQVVLRRGDKKEISILRTQLSLADQQYLRKLLTTTSPQSDGRLDNNLKCVDLSDLTGALPMDVVSSKQILRRSEPWEYSTWKPESRKDDTVGYPSVVRNDRGKNPDGKYYLYFAHHDPTSGIGCAIADSIAGPYRKLKVLDPGREHSMVLVNPHSPGKQGDPSHYSSPSLVWNEDEQLWFMYFHYYNHFHRLWEEHPDYPGGGNQMTALATTPDLSSHSWTIVPDERGDKVNIPKIQPVLATTKEPWMYGTSSYHAVQRLPTGDWLAFLRGTDVKGVCSVGFARSRDGRKWDLFPQNPRIRPTAGRDAELGIYRPGFIGYLGKGRAGEHRYLVVWSESRIGADVPRMRYGYTTDFVSIIPDRRGYAKWPAGDGLISPWRVDDKLYLFAAKHLHVMQLPVAR